MKNILHICSLVLLTLLTSCEDHIWPWGNHESGDKTFREKFDISATINPTSASYNPIPSSFTVTFPTNINMSSVTARSVIVSGSGTCPTSPLISISHVNQVATVLVDITGCSHQDKIKVVIDGAGIMNNLGQNGKGKYEATFTLNTDSAASPSIGLSSGSYNSFSGSFTVLFNSTIDMTSVTSQMFTLEGTGGCSHSPMTGLTVNGFEARITYDATGCAHGDSIKITMNNSTLLDTSNRRGVGVIERTMTLDTVGVDASFVTISAPSGDVNPFPATVSLNLPSDVDMSSVTLSDFIVTGSGSCPTNAISGITKNGSTVTIALNSTGCADGNKIDFSLPMSSVLDLAGNSGTGQASAEWRLVTSAPSSPSINLNGGVVASFPQNIIMDFADTIDLSTVRNAITVTSTGSCPVNPAGTPVLLNRQLTLSLDSQNCTHGDSLTVSIDMSLIKNTVGMNGSGIITRTFSLDQSGPLAPLMSVDSGSFADLPTEIHLNFGSDTDMSTVDSNSITAVGNGSCLPNAMASISLSGVEAVIHLNSAACANNDQIVFNVDLTKIKDVVGNAGSGIVTKVLTKDSSVPKEPTINITAGSMTVLPTSMDIQFDSDIDMATVDLSDFTIQGSGSCAANPLTGFSTVADTVHLLLNTLGCASGDSLIFTLNMSGISSQTGVAGSGIFRKIFTLDTEGPALPASSLMGGVVASLPTSVTFTYPTDTKMNTVGMSDFSAGGTGGCLGASVSHVSVNNFTATVTLDTSSCHSSDQLIVKAMMNGVTDQLGNPGAGETVVSFTLDTDGPLLPVIAPVSATLASFPASISVAFTTDTLMASVTTSDFTISGTNICSGSISNMTISGHTAWLTLSNQGCLHGDVLTLSLAGNGITDALGNPGTGSVQVQYTLDNIGISASSVAFSQNSGTFQSLPASVAVTFPSDTDMDSVDINDFNSLTNGSCPSNAIAGLTKSGHIATVTFNTFGCVSGNSVSLILNMSGVKDVLGNGGLGATMVTYLLDNVGPASATMSLATATVATLPSMMLVTFSDDTEMSSVTAADFVVAGTGSCSSASLSSFSKVGQSATLGFTTTGCVHGDSFSVSLNMSGVTDAIGNVGSGIIGRTFTLDTVGPVAPSVNLNSATVASLPGSLIFTFPSDTDMSSVTVADFIGGGTGTCPSNPVSGFAKMGQVVTLTLSTSGCGQGNAVSVYLSMSGVTDALGNAGTGAITRSFTLDSVGPAAAVINLATSTLQALPASVFFTFSSDTDMSSVTMADFTATGNGTCPMNALAGISAAGQIVTVNLNNSGCSNGNKITLTLNMTGVTDAVGNAGTGILSHVYTLDNVGPATAAVNLLSGTFQSLPASVNFTFTSDTDMSSVTASDFTAVGTGSCPLNALGSVTKVGQVATVNLNRSGCQSGDDITVALNMTGVTDAIGNAGAGILSQTYLLDNIGVASAVSNLAGGVFSSLPASVSFTFSSDTDMATVTAADFSAVGTGTCPANALGSVTKLGQVATVNLNRSGCVHNNQITLALNMAGVADAVGNAGTGIVSYVYELDIVGPANPSVSQIGSSLVTMPTSITYTFASDVNMSTVTTARFSATATGLCNPNPITGVTISGNTAVVYMLGVTCIVGGQIRLDVDMANIKDTTGNPGVGVFSNTYTKVL